MNVNLRACGVVTVLCCAPCVTNGFTVYRWRRGDAGWSVVAHLDGFGLRDVTRLAVSPKGDRLAIVAQK